MQLAQKTERLLKSLLEGPIGKKIEDEAEAERAGKCAKLRKDYVEGEAAFLAARRQLEQQIAEHEARLAKLKAELEPVEQQLIKARWLLADKIGAATEFRDRLWRELAAIADPRIDGYRADFEARLQNTASHARRWVTGRTLPGQAFPRTADNSLEVDRAAHYWLAAIEATARWAREGLQGKELERAFELVVAQCPSIPMGPDAGARSGA